MEEHRNGTKKINRKRRKRDGARLHEQHLPSVLVVVVVAVLDAGLDGGKLPPLVVQTGLPVKQEVGASGDNVGRGARGALGGPGHGLDEDVELVNRVSGGQELEGELVAGDVGIEVWLAGDDVVVVEGADVAGLAKDAVDLGDEVLVVEVDPVDPLGGVGKLEDGLPEDAAAVGSVEGDGRLRDTRTGEPEGGGGEGDGAVRVEDLGEGSSPAASAVSEEEHRVGHVLIGRRDEREGNRSKG